MATQPNIPQPDSRSDDVPGEDRDDDGRRYIGASEAREKIAEILSRVDYQDLRFVIERHGSPAAAVVPLEDLEALEELEHRADEAALEDVDDHEETVSLEEVEARLEGDD